MCGICGIGGDYDPAALDRMVGLLRHRGPEGAGTHWDQEAEVGLGHTRLAIIDLTEAAREPMTNENETLWLVFNGEIYNFRELRRQLEAKGHAFTSQCDAEVIVHLYEDEGPDCVKRLNGMFAFAIWDRGARRLFLARDPMGIKPLYYMQDGSRFYFASEPRPIGRVTGADDSVDPHALALYLTFLYVPGPYTIYPGIKKLPQGHALLWEDGDVQLRRYWRPQPTELPGEPGELAQEVRGRLFEAVRRQMVSDVPLGAFLSGGIDSSAVVAAMAEHLDTPVKTFSIGFEGVDASYDERPKARRVAELFDTEHREFLVRPDILDLLPKVVWSSGEPFADSSSLLTYLICGQTRREATVALTGIGGDELFHGYPRYLGLGMHDVYQRLPRPLRRLAASLAALSLPDRPTGRNRLGRLRRFLEAGSLSGAEAYLDWISFLPAAPTAGIFQDAFSERLAGYDPYSLHLERLEEFPDEGIVERAFLLDLTTYLPDDLLFLADRMSMAHALELRVPYCDPDLVELSLSLSARQKGPRGQLKGLLKAALRGVLPDDILQQPKQGFMAPMSHWLRSDLRPLCAALLSEQRIERRGILQPAFVQEMLDTHFGGRRDLSDSIYALLVLEIWQEVHQLESAPPPLSELL